jgi:hypothetical protein
VAIRIEAILRLIRLRIRVYICARKPSDSTRQSGVVVDPGIDYIYLVECVTTVNES